MSLSAPPPPAAPPKSSLMLQLLRWSLLASVGLVLGLLGLLFARPEVLLFYPSRVLDQTPDAIGWNYERVALESEDGETLVAWYLEADRPGPLRAREWTVLYCHGNGGNISGRLAMLEGLRELGLGVLILDYRGYGESSGRPTVAGTRLDVAAAWRHLVDDRGIAPGNILLWGRSLGGAIVIDQAARATQAGTPPAALVVESTFTSTVALGKQLYPWLPVGWFANKIDYPSRELLASIPTPVLLAHSPDDDLIPIAHGSALHAAAEAGAASRVGWIELSGGHNDSDLTRPWYADDIVAFLLSETRP